MRDLSEVGEVEWTTSEWNRKENYETEGPKLLHRAEEDSKVNHWGPLPDPASMMLVCPLRSGTSRDEPGMLTGSERTGWILHTYSMCALFHTQREHAYSNI